MWKERYESGLMDEAVDHREDFKKKVIYLSFEDIQKALKEGGHKVVWEKCDKEEEKYKCVVETLDGMVKLQQCLYVDFLLPNAAPNPTKSDALREVLAGLHSVYNQIPQWDLNSPPQLGTHQEFINSWQVKHYGWVVKSDRCINFSITEEEGISTFVPLQGKWWHPDESIFASKEEAEQEKERRELLSREYEQKREEEQKRKEEKAAHLAKLKREGKPIPKHLR